MSDKRLRLREQADRDLASSGSWTALVAYPSLLVITGLSSDLWLEYRPLVLISALAVTLFGLWRFRLGQRLRICKASQVQSFKRLYSIAVMGIANSWSLFAAISVGIYGCSWAGNLTILNTAGIVAASTSNFAPNYFLMRLYILTMVVPCCITLVTYGTHTETVTAFTLLFYGYFMLGVGRRHCQRYDSLSETVYDLDESRQKAEQTASDLKRSQEQFRLLAANQQQTLENERAQLAREVHDELGQLLTALRLELSWLERHIEEESTLQRTQTMNGLIDSTIASVRRISSSLRPPLLDELGLRPALDWLLQSTCGRAEINHQLQFHGNLRHLPSSLSLTLFRICQEALTNVLRHAQASQVEVEIQLNDTHLHMIVRDNGIGISPEQLRQSLGILGMRERAHLLGGRLDIQAGQGTGTTIEAHFPLETQSAG